MKQLKPGHTTTEFWLVAGGGIVSTALTCMGMVDGEWTVGAIAILGGVYTLIRGALKQKAQ